MSDLNTRPKDYENKGAAALCSVSPRFVKCFLERSFCVRLTESMPTFYGELGSWPGDFPDADQRVSIATLN